ncbi:hypothetical protein CALCODRAFT_510756 [Calocera cornea HHB12733]|uniref:Mitochondrial import inner membrane translocase subunit TIM54 n=1 Tax=Calocera cornea HHB12733 TaxID=1353952 RepID=A0A165EA36_9BASI|nr:hypothetical protein CALCODRAFT_510756 [Calocera cornea HHB12733]
MAVPGPSTPPVSPSGSTPSAATSAASTGSKVAAEAASAGSSGIRSVLMYTGIPPSLLRMPKLRLPSRNWLIFLGVIGSTTALFVYDRRECRRIRREACEKVAWMADLPLDPQGTVRRVKVYAARQPGDDESAKGMLYFRKWVKPILVAAAVDYDMVVGQRHGSITDLLAREIQHKRLVDAGLLPPVAGPTPAMQPAAEQESALQGGIVLIGRSTFKEYMEGLKRGYGESVSLGRGGKQRGDDEEDAQIAKELENDGVFDEPEVVDITSSGEDGAPPPPAPAPAQPQPFRNPFLPSNFELRPNNRFQPAPPAQAVLPAELTLPPQPPLLLLPFRNLVGISLVPRQIWGFFNRRYYAQSGAEHAFILLKGATRPFDPRTDLAFGQETEYYWPSKFDKVDADIDKRRTEYYKELAKKLKTARELASGERAPTKDEERNPPKTEQELRQDRFDREKRWKRELEGWKIVRRGQDPVWEEGWGEAVRVYDKEGEKVKIPPGVVPSRPEVIMSFQDGGFYSQQALIAALSAINTTHAEWKARPKPAVVGAELKLAKEDVELVMSELDYTKPQAERALRENGGDVQKVFDEYVKPAKPREEHRY